MTAHRIETPEEQSRYAAILAWGTHIGLGLALIGFALYLLGLVPGRVPLDQMPTLWARPASAYLEATGIAPGWEWIRLLDRGDFASLVGIVVLAACSGAGLLAVLPIYARRGDRVYVTTCILTVVVMALAASGFTVSLH